MHRNFAATAKFCKRCLEAGNNLKPNIPKSDVGDTYVPRDLWGPVNYVPGRKKYVLVAIDTFSHWPSSAYICSSNKSKIVLKFVRKNIITHGQTKKLQKDQAAGFFSKDILIFQKCVKIPKEIHNYTWSPKEITNGSSSRIFFRKIS